MEIPIYVIDAFTTQLFHGNPAAVCPLDEWLDDDFLQSIAFENNLSETAFVVKRDDAYDLRWFTPKLEVNLCGHATLATAHVLFSHLNHSHPEIEFQTRSGRLTVKKENSRLLMDFPALPPVRADISEQVVRSLKARPLEVWQAKTLCMGVFETESDIVSLAPDLSSMVELDARGIVATAKGDSVDFVSRFFAPKMGIPEDPVTGSVHCTMIPFWSERLGRKELHARQRSPRGGDLFCRMQGDRVQIGGEAVTYSKGMICSV